VLCLRFFRCAFLPLLVHCSRLRRGHSAALPLQRAAVPYRHVYGRYVARPAVRLALAVAAPISIHRCVSTWSLSICCLFYASSAFGPFASWAFCKAGGSPSCVPCAEGRAVPFYREERKNCYCTAPSPTHTFTS